MRQKCRECGDKIFKIVDGSVMCRKSHEYGRLLIKTGDEE